MEKKRSSMWVLIDVCFVTAISVPIVWSIIDYHLVPILAPIFYILLGSAFLFCKTYKEVSIVERILFWVSDSVYVPPKLESLHLFIGFLLIAVGIAYFVF